MANLCNTGIGGSLGIAFFRIGDDSSVVPQRLSGARIALPMRCSCPQIVHTVAERANHRGGNRIGAPLKQNIIKLVQAFDSRADLPLGNGTRYPFALAAQGGDLRIARTFREQATGQPFQSFPDLINILSILGTE